MGLPAPFLATEPAAPNGGVNLLIATPEVGRDQAAFIREALHRACPKRLVVTDTLAESFEQNAVDGVQQGAAGAPAWAVERAAAALAARCHAAAVLLNSHCWEDRRAAAWLHASAHAQYAPLVCATKSELCTASS